MSDTTSTTQVIGAGATPASSAATSAAPAETKPAAASVPKSETITKANEPAIPSASGAGVAGGDAKQQSSLDDHPDFRRFKSETDKRVSAAEQARRDADTRASELENRLAWFEQQAYANADPQTKLEMLEQREQARLERDQLRQRGLQQQAQVLTVAETLVEDSGLDPMDPEIRKWIEGAPGQGGMVALQRNVIKRVRGELDAIKAEIPKIKQQARQQALAEYGVTKTVSNTGGAGGDLASLKAKVDSAMSAYQKHGRPEDYVAWRTAKDKLTEVQGSKSG